MIRAFFAPVVILAFPTVALADVLEVQPVTNDVLATVGPFAQRSTETLANNATFGLVVTPEAAVADLRARADDHIIALAQFPGAGLDGTEPAYADVTFETDYTLEFGGLSFDIMRRGGPHTPGDSFVWLHQRGVMFTGDIVYVDRLLGKGPVRDTAAGSRYSRRWRPLGPRISYEAMAT